MLRLMRLNALLAALIISATPAFADDLLNGRVYSGMIGPAEDPDLKDSLHFRDGRFWSDICTRCGFTPGPYSTETTDDGIRFTGRLESDTRGQFDYVGLVRPDGTIDVRIRWEKKRWYWTSSRDIVFRGHQNVEVSALELTEISAKLAEMDPDGHPLCARF